jgi:transposase
MVKKYEVEFKQTIVELYQAGQGVTSLSKEYGITSSTIYKWIDLYAKDTQTKVSNAELKAMRKEMAKLKEQNEILKKAIVIFTNK